MEKKRLTQKFIDGLKPRQQEYVVRDIEVPGLGVRVYASGRVGAGNSQTEIGAHSSA